ncbi:MAG: guanylate kinase [Proteobacteria bacterium]|nr:guanylate kinase [Pseudomonadota bacterium]
MTPKVFVVSAPSGTGKTTLNTRLMRDFPNVEISISHTTRAMRPGEESGKAYHFVTKEDFQQMIRRGEMLEWADVFGNLYGTSHNEIKRIKAKNHHVLLEIDVQGTRSILNQIKNAVTVFILPPSAEALWLRLETRGTDKLEDRWRRVLTAKQEIEVGYLYEHFIINDERERAYEELRRILIEGKHSSVSHSQGVQLCQKLLEEFETSPLLNGLKQKFNGPPT